jgi:hypothetical protein
MSKDTEAIQHEDGIVWTEDTAPLDYVRETLEPSAGTRRHPVPWRGPGRRVGYSVLKPNAPSDAPGMFSRRVFWVKGHDRLRSLRASTRLEPRSRAWTRGL